MPSNQFPSASGDDSSSGWFLFDPSKGAGNQAKSNVSETPVFDAPEITQLNPADAYDQALKYQSAVGRNSQSLQKDAMAEAGRQSLENYQAKAGIDSKNKLVDAQNAGALQNQTGRGITGGGASIVGAGAFTSPTMMADPYGMSGLKTDFQGIKNFGDMQNMAALSQSQFGAISARNEGAKAREVAMGQAEAQKHLMAQQNLMDSAKSAREQAFQTNEALRNRASQERINATNAQAGILGSLFSSVGSGNPNYRYWG